MNAIFDGITVRLKTPALAGVFFAKKVA